LASSSLGRLQELLSQYRGGQCAVLLRYRCPAAAGVLSFGAEWKVRPAAALLEQLEELLGAGSLQLRYTIPSAASEAVG
jgi:hypothetical protein